MDNTPRPAPSELYIKHQDGAIHALRGRRLAKLCREVTANRGQPEIVQLVEAGYEGFVARDGNVWDFEALGPTTW